MNRYECAYCGSRIEWNEFGCSRCGAPKKTVPEERFNDGWSFPNRKYELGKCVNIGKRSILSRFFEKGL